MADRAADEERRAGDRRRDPMGDEAAEAALIFLTETAAAAGKAKAEMVYMERHRKIVLARLKRSSGMKSDAAAETYARAHEEYEAACVAEYAAIERHEALYWRRIHAAATLDAWRTKNANMRDAGRMQ